MANTRETMGEQACLDALVENTLTSFEDDGVTKVGTYCLYFHDQLVSVKLPYCTQVGAYGMAECGNLESVDILGGGTISNYAFKNDKKLKDLLIRGNTLSTVGSYIFDGTPILNKEGAVFVPDSMVSTYKGASFWKTLVIKPLSKYPTDDYSTIDDSWDDIITACGNGTYSSKYSIGDTKSIEIDGKTYYMQLVGKDVDVLASDGTTTVPTSWLMYRRVYNTHSFDSSNRDWEHSGMRAWLSATVLPLFPSNVQAAIKEVRKYSSGLTEIGGYVTDGCVTADKLWIPSMHELNAGTTYETQGATYSTTLYPTGSSTATKKLRIKYPLGSDSAVSWWLRTVYSSAGCSCIGTSGNTTSYALSNSISTCFGFCI